MTLSANPAFECPVAGCKMIVPASSGGVLELCMATHNWDAHGAMTTPLTTGALEGGAGGRADDGLHRQLNHHPNGDGADHADTGGRRWSEDSRAWTCSRGGPGLK